MKIDGRVLAKDILKDLEVQVKKLKKKKIVPRLAVVLVGNDPASLSFVKQKRKAANYIGAKLDLHHFTKIPNYQKIAEFLLSLSRDPQVHGIILQRPLPPSLSASVLTGRISLKKDIDGFLPKSPYLPPVGLAVFKILKEIYFKQLIKKSRPKDDFSKNLLSWLKQKKIVLIGRGETGGRPIADTLSRYHQNLIILNSQSENKEEYIRSADIMIVAVGKSNVIQGEFVKNEAIVIGVGVHKEKGKLVGDFIEKEIAQVARFYTPTPGGMGPVNVACLMQNLVTACKLQRRK